MRYAEVAVDVPTGHSQTFSYSIPEGMELTPGQLVRVPFGPRTLQGIVFSLSPTSQVSDDETRPVLDVTTPTPALDSPHLSLARWISEHCVCSLFEAAAPMLPPGGRRRPHTYLSISPDVEDTKSVSATDVQRRVIDEVERRGPVELDRLISTLGEWARSSVSSLLNRGVLVRRVRTARPAAQARFVESLRVRKAAMEEIVRWLSGEGNKAPRQSELVTRLAESDESIGAIEARREFGGSVVSALIRKRFLEVERVRVLRYPLEGRVFEPGERVALTEGQRAVVLDVVQSLRDSERLLRTFLVQGVTGSGKTEIYLSAVEECLKLGKQAIVMVPEIALTPQTIERFAGRFPGKVAVLHSGLTPGQQHDQWWAIKAGEYSVVVGSRSAVFAPVSSPGLVVLDEEHEWTYKQHDAQPRYHSRDVAVALGRLTGAVTLLGSASPDVGSYYRGRRKRYGLHLLPDRLRLRGDGSTAVAPLPQVQIVDMRVELRDGNADIFSRRLQAALESCLDSGSQAIMFLNRRGTASQMQCRNCGYSVSCGGCDVPLTYHRATQRLICHYCGRRRRVPDNCPECLAYRLSFYGIGTQSVADHVAELFPQARIIRWDRDATRYPREYEELLTKFRNRDADVLVGTQMIAKGLHLPGVTLVGVVLADIGLTIPDYRSGERTFQLLCQVAGRAGRGDEPGSVVFQTYQPDNYAIKAAAAQDYQSFYEAEMRHRHEHGNPPYSRLIRLLHSHTNNAVCESRAKDLAETLRTTQRNADLTDVEVLGPTPPFPPRFRGRYRWHVVLKGRNPRSLLDIVDIPQGWTVDVDPVALT